MVTFGVLGLWQLNVARDKGRAEQVSTAPTRPIADLDTVLIPHGSFPDDGAGRRIFATGRYDGSGQVLVTPRRLAGVTRRTGPGVPSGASGPAAASALCGGAIAGPRPVPPRSGPASCACARPHPDSSRPRPCEPAARSRKRREGSGRRSTEQCTRIPHTAYSRTATRYRWPRGRSAPCSRRCEDRMRGSEGFPVSGTGPLLPAGLLSPRGHMPSISRHAVEP